MIIGGWEDVQLLAATFSGSLINIDYLRLFSVYRNIHNSNRGLRIDFTLMLLLTSDTASNPNTIVTGGSNSWRRHRTGSWALQYNIFLTPKGHL